MTELKFTTDWTTNNTPIWYKHLLRFIGKPDSIGLEIGTWEGRSTEWFLANVVTGEGSRLITVDHNHSRFEENAKILHSRHKDRLIVETMDAKHFLIAQADGKPVFDWIYLDGPKDAADVLAQTVLCWEVLKPNGVLIFDDYQWPGTHNGGFDNPPRHYSNPPRFGIDAFLTLNYLNHELLHSGWQKIVRKK